MLYFRVGDIKSATVTSQLTKMKIAKMKKMQVVNLLFLPFYYSFPSLNIAKTLLLKKTTFFGTINRIRREIPDSVKSTHSPLHTTKVLTTGNITLTSYQGVKNKNVLPTSYFYAC